MEHRREVVAAAMVAAGLAGQAAGQGCQWMQIQANGPSARSSVAMAFDAARGYCLIFGGAAPQSQFMWDTWSWNGTAWSLRAVSGPGIRSGHAMAFDAARSVVVLYGGRNGAGPYSDTWTWNGLQWEQRFVIPPPA